MFLTLGTNFDPNNIMYYICILQWFVFYLKTFNHTHVQTDKVILYDNKDISNYTCIEIHIDI